MQLYDYQERLVAEIRAAYASGYSAPLMVLPTGGGKTLCFSYMAMKAAERGKRVVLLAHRKELVGQISTALKNWDVEHGIISPDAKPTAYPVQVAMVQTLARRIQQDENGRLRFDWVIVDECHHATPNSTWGAIIQHNARAKLLGVTATPCRLDGQGLGRAVGGFFDILVEGPSVEALIARNRLAQPVVFAADFCTDLSAIKQRGGDYERKGLGEAMRSARLIGDAVGHYRQHCGGAPAIAFTVDIAHAEAVKEDFSTAGYAAAVLTGSTPKLTRAQMIADLGTGQLNVLASCNVISEGTDIPRVEAAILLRPTLSYGLAMQQMGRALRSFPGKSRAIILDHASNTHKHGLPTETVRWSLDSVVKRSGQGEALKTCFDCGASMGIRVAVCPLCGKILSSPKEMEEGEQEDAFPVVREGHLVEMTPERRAQLREWRKKAERKASHYADFQAIGQVMGYKPGWAKYRYEELKNGN